MKGAGSMFIVLSAAIAPGLALLSYFYLRNQMDTEPRRTLLHAFIYGAIITFPVLFIQFILEEEHAFSNPFMINVVFTSSIEEFVKWLIILAVILRHIEFDDPYDGVLYGAAWVARMIPDGYISGHANQARITTFPLKGKNTISSKVDNMVIIGGMRYTFTKALGGKIGNSICEDDKMDLALDLMKKMDEHGVKYYLPTDSVIADKFDNNANTQIVPSNAVPDGWESMDCGPESCKMLRDVIMSSKTILWNGPAGVFELPTFAKGTNEIAKCVAEACKQGTFAAVGGGDSVAAVKQMGLADQMSYVSTGGGAMLEYLEGKVLPGIAAIKD